MLLMVEKGIRAGICHSIYWYANANNKYMKDYDKNKESSDIQYWDANDLYWWTTSDEDWKVEKLVANLHDKTEYVIQEI